MKIVAFGQAIIHEPVSWPKHLLDLASNADAVLLNFEGCLPATGAWPMKSKTVHPAHPDALEMLKSLGVTHLAFANNHAWDFGHQAIIDTREKMQEAGFAVAGAGRDMAEASKPAIRNGVALIAVDAGPTPDWAVASTTPGISPLRLTRTLGLPQADITRLLQITGATGDRALREKRRAIGYDTSDDGPDFYGVPLAPSETPQEIWQLNEADFSRLAATLISTRANAQQIIVAIHYHLWASDWNRPPVWLHPLALRIAELGADAIVCTGPPIAYGLHHHANTAIAPSLGNLVFHTSRGKDYDRLGHQVWQGGVLILDEGQWRMEKINVSRPHEGTPRRMDYD